MDSETENNLINYQAKSGHFVPVWTIEIQTPIVDVNKILDAVMEVHALSYGRYQRNASISAEGMETSQAEENSTTTTHIKDYQAGQVETYPMVELKVSIERESSVLEKVMDVIHHVHQYEEPVIFLREDWVSRANYNPNNDNPNRWWNNGRGMPNKIEDLTKK